LRTNIDYFKVSEKEMHNAIQSAYDEAPQVGFFDTGFRDGFRFAKNLATKRMNIKL
jgi:hypothetical protein